jgi:CHAT domain-containing protein/Tfp pilus assembly protein PilF
LLVGVVVSLSASSAVGSSPPPELSRQQQEQLKERAHYAREVNRLLGEKKLTEAIATAEKVLAIERQLFGDVHPNVVEDLGWLADIHLQRRDFAAARRAFEEILAIRVKLHGEKDWRVTDARTALADVDMLAKLDAAQWRQLLQAHDLTIQVKQLERQGKYQAALPLAEKALRIHRSIYGEQHRFYADALGWVALLHDHLGAPARAEPLFRNALEIHRQALGELHPSYADSLNNLAEVTASRGDYVQAKRLFEQVRVIIQQTLGEKHARYATALGSLASVDQEMGSYTEAGLLYREALEIRKQVLGEKHPDYLMGLNALATLHLKTGEYDKAEPLLQKALRIRKGMGGEKHPEYALSLHNLARLYQDRGDLIRAESLFQQALAIAQEALGENHPSCAVILNSLASLYQSLGDYPKAESLLQKAVRIHRQTLGEMHPSYAASLQNLAVLYCELDDTDRARSLYEQTRKIHRETLGERHPVYATTLSALGLLYRTLGDYKKAEPLLRQALEITQQALGEKHPSFTTRLNNLAVLLQLQGEPARAEPLFSKALQLDKERVGDKHPDYAIKLSNLAAVCDDLGQYDRADSLFQESIRLSRANLELAAAMQSERQQLALLRILRYQLDCYLLPQPRANRPIERLYEHVLAWKGNVSLRQYRQRVTRQHPELARDFAELDRISSRLAALALAPPQPEKQEARRRQIQEWTEEKERLEVQLARRSRAFEQVRQWQHLTPAQLQALLPPDTALLDFLVYTRYRPSRCQHLAAFVVRRDRVLRVELGPTRHIKEALASWRLALQRRFRTRGDDDLAVAVRRLIWQPLEEHLQGARLVLISPDGDLARVPFAALPGKQKDSYLLQEQAIAVVPVPQLLPELLARRDGQDPGEPSLLLVGDVRYDSIADGGMVVDSRMAARRSADALFRWSSLPNTRVEIEAIAEAFRRGSERGALTQLCQAEATETAVRRQAPAHRYLHFATHGYFAPGQLRSALTEVSRSEAPDAVNLFNRGGLAGFHPGLLSGLVLAGANQPVDMTRSDGILTALEVQTMDLTGVELATLSACETGLGEVAGGEGLLGLQRAFQVAGARSVVAGLWQVDDAATRQLMVQFYDNLWRKKLPRLEALRQAQLWMLKEGDAWMRQEGINRGMIDVKVPKERLAKDDGRLPPYYWAAFTLSGDWR